MHASANHHGGARAFSLHAEMRPWKAPVAAVPTEDWSHRNKFLDNGFIYWCLGSAIARIGEPPWDR